MDEQAKIILYKQLMKVQLIAKLKEESLIGWEDFLKLSSKETLRYTIDYRDKALKEVNTKKDMKKSNKKDFYIELPEMNLEGEDLSDVYLHTFMAGYSKERNNGKKIFITTNINLKDTNCVVNLATIHPIIVSEDGVNVKEISADIKKCDFRGCKVFGKFQNTKAKLVYTEKNLPKEYIERLEKYVVPKEVELTTDYMYIDMLEGKNVKGMRGLEKVKQIVDFDLTVLKKDIWKYRDVIKGNNIDISYTGAFITEYGFDSIGKENYYIDLETRAKDAYKADNMEYVEEVFSSLDKDTRKNLTTLALRDGKMDFVKKHEKELTNFQKRYLDMQKKESKEKEEAEKIKEVLRQEYKNKHLEFGMDIMKAPIETRNDLIEEIYKLGDVALVEKYLDEIDVKLKNDILEKEYRKGNEEYVYRNFSKIDNGELKEKIIEKEWNAGNVDFLCDNYDSIENESLKSKILELAFNKEKSRFLKVHFDDLPRNLQIEAIIKFKNLGIPESKMLELLKK